MKPQLLVYLLFFVVQTWAAPTADSLVYSFSNFQDSTKRDLTLSSDIDTRSEPGKLLLALGNTKNLGRLSRFSTAYLGSFPPSASDPTLPDTAKINGNNLGDGSFFTFVEFPAAPVPNIGSYIKVDLRSIRKVNSVVLVNLFNSVTSYRTRARAFSLYSGLDSNSLSRVYQESDNVDTANARYTMNIADVRPIQYLRLSIDRLDAKQSTVISEIQIFGEGFVPEGIYISKVDSFASAVNFAKIYAGAEFEEGTSISLQMRTGPTKTVDSVRWSDWSAPVFFTSAAMAAAGADIRLKEPRKYFQYRINLFTSNVGTPRVNKISFTYQTKLIADSVSAAIAPRELPAFEKSLLTYKVKAKLSGSSIGFDSLRIFTPSPTSVQNVLVNGSAVNYTSFVTPEKIIIGFPTTVSSTSEVEVKFYTKLISDAKFISELVNKNSPWNPQNIEPEQTSTGESWKVTTTGVSPKTLVNVRIDPNPFTPNGDGKNDETVVDFAVANIEKLRTLRIEIFDLVGKKIRTVVSQPTGISPYYGNPRYGGKGIVWDGKDDNGKIVLPGVYLMQVSIDIDNGGELLTKTVVVAY